MMKIKIFGKKGCGGCEATKSKFETFLSKWGVKDAEIIFYDMDTIDGLTEASLYNATDIPTTVIEDEEDKEVIRWAGRVPTSQEFKGFFKS